VNNKRYGSSIFCPDRQLFGQRDLDKMEAILADPRRFFTPAFKAFLMRLPKQTHLDTVVRVLDEIDAHSKKKSSLPKLAALFGEYRQWLSGCSPWKAVQASPGAGLSCFDFRWDRDAVLLRMCEGSHRASSAYVEGALEKVHGLVELFFFTRECDAVISTNKKGGILCYRHRSRRQRQIMNFFLPYYYYLLLRYCNPKWLNSKPSNSLFLFELLWSIDFICQEGCDPVTASCVTISNPGSLSSSETGVNLGIRS
jgi:hypothetical protein